MRYIYSVCEPASGGVEHTDTAHGISVATIKDVTSFIVIVIVVYGIVVVVLIAIKSNIKGVIIIIPVSLKLDKSLLYGSSKKLVFFVYQFAFLVLKKGQNLVG